MTSQFAWLDHDDTQRRRMLAVVELSRMKSAHLPERSAAELRRLEVRLIHALINGGETEGVIGRQAREKLKRMPSAAYWATHG